MWKYSRKRSVFHQGALLCCIIVGKKLQHNSPQNINASVGRHSLWGGAEMEGVQNSQRGAQSSVGDTCRKVSPFGFKHVSTG